MAPWRIANDCYVGQNAVASMPIVILEASVVPLAIDGTVEVAGVHCILPWVANHLCTLPDVAGRIPGLGPVVILEAYTLSATYHCTSKSEIQSNIIILYEEYLNRSYKKSGWNSQCARKAQCA